MNPIAPVAQNAHCSAQPACDEMHSVIRSPSGMATVSIASPSRRRNRNFSVPSFDRCRAAISSRGKVELRGERFAKGLWQIGHRREVGGRILPEAPNDLVDAIRRLRRFARRTPRAARARARARHRGDRGDSSSLPRWRSLDVSRLRDRPCDRQDSLRAVQRNPRKTYT